MWHACMLREINLVGCFYIDIIDTGTWPIEKTEPIYAIQYMIWDESCLFLYYFLLPIPKTIHTVSSIPSKMCQILRTSEFFCSGGIACRFHIQINNYFFSTPLASFTSQGPTNACKVGCFTHDFVTGPTKRMQRSESTYWIAFHVRRLESMLGTMWNRFYWLFEPLYTHSVAGLTALGFD
jgi:hypothetical protein